MTSDVVRAIAHGGFLATIGLDLAEITPDRVVATLQIEPRHLQPFGYLHGGVDLVLAETVASLGGLLNCPPGSAAFGIEINANLLRPIRSGLLTAVTAALQLGRTTHVWDIEITADTGHLICASRCTVAIVPVDRPSPAETPSPGE